MSAAAAKRVLPNQEKSALTRVRRCLERIEAVDGQIRAFVRLAPDAESKAAELDRVGHHGRLAGCPIAIKDLMATASLGTEYGSDLHAGHVPSEDADCVRLLKKAGAVVLGKTATTEFAHLRPALTRNPWNLDHTPGGSSSGSAAAVAAGMVPLALGTQTGGSVIRPASYCGVFGFKASQGRASMAGVHALAPSFDSLGWFAASSADLSLLADILMTPAPAAVPTPGSKPLRLGRLRTLFDSQAHPSVTALVDTVCGRLADCGLDVPNVVLPIELGDLHDLHQRVVAVEASRSLAAYQGGLSPQLAEFVAFGHACVATYEADLALVDAARQSFAALARGFDALILPSATGEAPGLESTGDAAFSLPFSLLGSPCASLPAGRGPQGLPLGVQLVARHGADEALLSAVCFVSQRLALEPMALAPPVPRQPAPSHQNFGRQNG